MGPDVVAAVLQLYSSVDCTAKVLRAVYGEASRGYKDSTRFLFKDFPKITGAFPEAVKEYLSGVAWHEDLRFLRDELSSSRDRIVPSGRSKEPCLVSGRLYLARRKAAGVGRRDSDGSTLTLQNVNGFLSLVFHVLNGTLADTRIVQFCGLKWKAACLCSASIQPRRSPSRSANACRIYGSNVAGRTLLPFVTACGTYTNTRPQMASFNADASLGRQLKWHPLATGRNRERY